MAQKKETRGRPRMKGGEVISIKLDRQALRDAKALGKLWETTRSETIRKALRAAAYAENGQEAK